jgi:O-acetyl-ADP-ribose deacetylase (regulator of RNase III)
MNPISITYPETNPDMPEGTMSISFIIGDATQPDGDGTKLIVHVCNDIGGWGRGFVVALSKRWHEPEQRYRAWHRGEEKTLFALGEVQFVKVADSIWVANLIGQRDVRTVGGTPPVRYEAIRKGLRRVAEESQHLGVSVHMPRIGCGLAGGKWEEVAKIVEEELTNKGVLVTVYDLAA